MSKKMRVFLVAIVVGCFHEKSGDDYSESPAPSLKPLLKYLMGFSAPVFSLGFTFEAPNSVSNPPSL